MLKCYLLSFIMTNIIILYLITEVDSGKSGKPGNSLKYGQSGECEEYNKYNEEFKHGLFGLFGSIDFGCSSTRCQCYQHK